MMATRGNIHPHIEEHFEIDGLCQCPCSECTTTLGLCVCIECVCDSQGEHDFQAELDYDRLITFPWA